MRRFAIAGLIVSAALLAACSGGGGYGGPHAYPQPYISPVLIPGTVAQYTGTVTVAHVFPNPAGTQANYTGAYTFTSTRSVDVAQNGAPAPIDVHAVLTYTTTQNPGTGVTLASDTTDTFFGQFAANGGTAVQEFASFATTTGIDESAGAAGGGPFTKTVNTNTIYAQPQLNGIYPLVAGATANEPVGRSVVVHATDANGATPDTATTFVASSQEQIFGNGSYQLGEQLSNGEVQTTTENANGSGTIAANGPPYTLNDSIGVPVNAGAGYTIPVTTERQNATTGATPAPTATAVAYSAADWYPGNALPAVPFETDVVTVKGPAPALPSGCAGAIAEPNVFEIDTTMNTLNIDASYTTQAQQTFNSNGTPVCVLRTTVANDYTLTTGILSQTTTTTYAQILTSLMNGSTTSAASRKT